MRYVVDKIRAVLFGCGEVMNQDHKFHGSLQLAIAKAASAGGITNMKEKAFNVFREHFPDLTLEFIPELSTPHEYVWEIFSKWGCYGVGGRESNAALMRWTKHSDTIALKKRSDAGWIEYHNRGVGGDDIAHFVGRAIQTYFPETVAGRGGTIAFIFAFPNGDTLMQRARGYDEGTTICEFPYFEEKTWLEFLSLMHGLGDSSSSFTIDTEANTDVIRIDYGRNDFAVIIRIDLDPSAVVAHLFKKIGYGADFGTRNFRDVYTLDRGDYYLKLTPETARFMCERLEYNFRPKKMLKERQEEEYETEEGWLRMHQRQLTHSANNSSAGGGSSNKRPGNFYGEDDEMMMAVDRDSCCGAAASPWAQNKRPNR